MEAIRAPRGTRDILPEESWKWAYVLRVFGDVAATYGYGEVHLPIFEQTELFCRGIGETTDVVEKEMYTFEDRGGRSVTLRPELTASMVRSYLEHEMGRQRQPVKLWGWGPMFRYERPQKGRYREFRQLDAENLGSSDPFCDVEVIDLSLEFFRRLGMKNLEVLVNSVGCPACRPAYREALRRALEPKLPVLCESCRSRYDRNPLRILDCKRPECREATEDAPSILDSLCDECRVHFDATLAGLSKLGATHRLDKRLVRGLDYYTKTAYEVLSGDLGAQNAVCGGGRYDNLAEAIGGPHVPGVGFATGFDRVVLTMDAQGCGFGRPRILSAFVAAVEEKDRPEALALVHRLRGAGIGADLDFGTRSLKNQMKQASALGARFAVLVGGDEATRGAVGLKELVSGEQREVSLDKLLSEIAVIADSAD
jgi:histidyl-tRNA synthetase